MPYRLTVAAMRFLPYPFRLAISRNKAASRLAARLVGEQPNRVVGVRSGPLAGLRLELNLSKEKSILIGTHEPRMRALLESSVEPEMTAWDIGAHIGFFSLVLARTCRTVIAVEAHPENARRLRRNVELNNAQIQIVEMAVADRPGQVVLTQGPMSGTHRLAGIDGPRWKDEAPDRTTSIQATTLDLLAKEYGFPDLVKIDIEGAEIVALRGASEVLQRHPVIVCETHGSDIRVTVEAILRSAGYGRIDNIDGDHLVARR
jgi:FkbM family methyltransferase